MQTLSTALIVRNEEETLGRILGAAQKFSNEIVVVDTGSTDDTVCIAERYGAVVHHFEWINDFAAARNYSFAQCTKDWILWLDADDVLPQRSIEVAEFLKRDVFPDERINCLMCPYNYIIDSAGKVLLTNGRARFVRRSAKPVWVGRVHEDFVPPGQTIGSCPDFVVDHMPTEKQLARKSTRNLDIYDSYINLDTASLHELFQYAGELADHGDLFNAIKVYDTYLSRVPKDKQELFATEYLVHVKLAEIHRILSEFPRALHHAGAAVAYDCSRAEAYGMLGLIHKEMKDWRKALVAFQACTHGIKPDRIGVVVFDTFYDNRVWQEIDFCRAQLDLEQK